MTNYRVHDAGVTKARSMIDAGQYDLTTEWEAGQPTTDDENDKIERDGHDGHDGYGEWHLAIDTGASEQTKDRYGFPYGDFRRVFRSALIASKQRASQFGHDDVERAARRTARPPRPGHGLIPDPYRDRESNRSVDQHGSDHPRTR